MNKLTDNKIIKPTNILWFFVLLNLLIGIFIVSDFGRSTDESNDYKRSQFAYEIYSGAYQGSIAEGYEELDLAKYYGTASGTIVRFVEQVFFQDADHANRTVAHFSYFSFYQLAIVAIFFLAKQFLDEWTSLVVAILFGTQPLLIGHAFMNPKDIPLLTVFLCTVVLGFRMVDQWQFENNRLTADRENNKGRVVLVVV